MSLRGGVGLWGPIRKRKIGPIGGEKKDGERGRGSVRLKKNQVENRQIDKESQGNKI